ncbi:reverse transcriptase, partial [Reticulomyxa filosa]
TNSKHQVMNRVGLKLTFQVKEDGIDPIPAIVCFNLDAFENEIKEARKITDFIVIGGDWNANHSAWFNKDIGDIGESVMDFIINNNLHILNSSPFDHTYEKRWGKIID